MRFLVPALLLATLAVLPGCGTSTSVPTSKYAATLGPVFLTEGRLDGVDYEVIGPVSVAHHNYGGDGVVKDALAQAAKKAGADAVIGVHTWQQTGFGTWAEPHAAGTAVKFKTPQPDLAKRYSGEWH